MNAILKERVGVSADMGEIIECLRVRISMCQLTNGREIKGENNHCQVLWCNHHHHHQKRDRDRENDSAILGGQQRTKSEKYPNSLQNDLTAERYQNFNFSHRHPLAAAGCASVGRAHRKRYNAAFLHVRTDRPSGQWSLPMRCDATNRFDSIPTE